MSFTVGETVGPYRITEQIGQGGMATVYKAYHANLDRYVAFKVLHPAFKEDPNFLERFKREAQIVARMEHPTIVPIYDYADYQGNPFLVMKFIDGETLKARMKRQPLTLADTLRIMTAVAGGLTYAHQQGILHRDIKPSNIMIDRQGTPYIADFGLARIAQAGESTLSQDMMLGTPQYISPEQAQGVRDLTPATDIYSLGAVLYEIVVGRVPYNADTPYAIVHDHIYKPLPLPTQVNPQVPVQVERVLLKALSKQPEDRYPSASDMIAAFREAVEAAGLTELSVSRHRSSAVPNVSSSVVTLPPDSFSVPRTPTPAPAPSYAGIPAPASMVMGSSASRQAYRRRANLWILGGLGALLLTCLAGLYIIVRAVSNPDLRPWAVADNADTVGAAPLATSAPMGQDANTPLTVEQAQQNVDAHPDDARANLVLAVAQAQAGNAAAAAATLAHAVNDLHAPGELLAGFARQAADNQRSEIATWLYLAALSRPDLPAPLRNDAGDYLYQQAQSNTGPFLAIVSRVVDEQPNQALLLTFHALALLNSNRPLSQRQAWNHLEAVRKLDDTLAETYLVRGMYYAAQGQNDQARVDWERAAAFPDAPGWVKREADRLLHPA